jgi:Trk-type K+ transport system membrane component
MIFAALAQFAVCFLILAWVLKKKTGEPYSRKAVIRFVLFGALGVILFFCLTLVLPIQEDTFYKAEQQSTTSIGASAPHGCG